MSALAPSGLIVEQARAPMVEQTLRVPLPAEADRTRSLADVRSGTPGVPAAIGESRLFRHSRWDGVLVLFAFAHGAVVLAFPVIPAIAIGLWWNSNTIAHYFIHAPYFRSRWLNLGFSAYQSVLLGVPQALWRDRHLAHHTGESRRIRITGQLLVEASLVAGLWTLLAALVPWFFLGVYLPGYAIGLAIGLVHGYYEHRRGTTSHYGRLYNWLFFNDGYHVEHHAAPGTHWTRLPERRDPQADRSRWPAVFRWMENFGLSALEKLALHSARVQRYLLRCHERAFRRLLGDVPPPVRVGIVGGGLFPRTAIVLRRMFPLAELVVIDANPRHVERARSRVEGQVTFVEEWFDPDRHIEFDVLVLPLSYVGDRGAIYRSPPAPLVLVHDWIHRRKGAGCTISWLLLKRLNLVRR